jgi:hypothetical protein
MIDTVTEWAFIDRFVAYDRLNTFGYDGCQALFEYLEQLEDDIGEQIELDVIALCCDYTRFESLAEFNEQHGEECESLDDVRDKTTVIEIDDDAFIIQNY